MKPFSTLEEIADAYSQAPTHARRALPRALEGNRRWLEAKAWLQRHGEHTFDCMNRSAVDPEASACTCGLSALLGEESTS